MIIDDEGAPVAISAKMALEIIKLLEDEAQWSPSPTNRIRASEIAKTMRAVMGK